MSYFSKAQNVLIRAFRGLFVAQRHGTGEVDDERQGNQSIGGPSAGRSRGLKPTSGCAVRLRLSKRHVRRLLAAWREGESRRRLAADAGEGPTIASHRPNGGGCWSGYKCTTRTLAPRWPTRSSSSARASSSRCRDLARADDGGRTMERSLA